MVASDREAVAVAGYHHHVQVRPREREPGGVGKRPAMGHMKSVGVDVGGEPPGAADAGHHRELVLVYAQLMDGPEQSPERDAVAAAGAKEVRHHLQTQIIAHVESGSRVDDRHLVSFASASAHAAISAGVIGSPL